MSGDPIAGVLLAAGMSTRMGNNKLFVELEGKSLLRRAVETARDAGLLPILVVLGHERDRARNELAGLPCQLVENPDYARGMNTSLRAGIAAVPESADAAVVMLADMPFVSAAMIRALVERFRSASAPLALSLYDGVIAPPTLYGRALFPEIDALDGDGCGKRIIQQHRGQAIEVSWPAQALTDLDLPEDVQRVRSLLGDAQDSSKGLSR